MQSRIDGGHFFLNEWSVLEVKGSDGLDFLNRQTTNSLEEVSQKRAILTTKLNRGGQVVAFFYVFFTQGKLYLLVPQIGVDETIADLSKFIIMDDVSLERPLDEPACLYTGLVAQEFKQDGVAIDFYGDEGVLVLAPKSPPGVLLAYEEIELLRVLNGYPKWEEVVSRKKLINDTRLNEVAVNYKKGCFLGQETAAKIQNNRGAAYFPVLVELEAPLNSGIDKTVLIEGQKRGEILESFVFEKKNYITVSLHREYRVEKTKIPMEIAGANYQGVVQYFPYFKARSTKEKSRELFESGAEAFQRELNDEAIALLETALKFDPENTEAYESLGVIHGRLGAFEKAIDLMNELERIDPLSVMAHTNKSLYFMKLGKIEEAEAEKSQATLKSFEMYGKIAEDKNQKEVQKKQKENELLGRMKMFQQVLEIDAKDEIANYGMADVSFYWGKFEEAVQYLEIVLAENPKYSNAYTLLGKCYEALGEKSKARETYSTGVNIAKARGDLMPANEMQSRLLQLGS